VRPLLAQPFAVLPRLGQSGTNPFAQDFCSNSANTVRAGLYARVSTQTSKR